MSLAIVALASFFAGVAQGSIGFGMALVLAPFAMFALAPSEAVPVVVLMSLLNTGLVSLHARRDVVPSLLIPLAVGGVAGFQAGVGVLLATDGNLLKFATGLFVAVFSLAMWRGWRRPLPENTPVLAAVGLVSGFMGGSTSMGGPPVVLFLSNQRTPREKFRANLIAFFFIMNCFGLVTLLWNGLFSPGLLSKAALFLPGILAGTLTGMWLSGRVREAFFQRVVLLVAGLAGVSLMLASAGRLL